MSVDIKIAIVLGRDARQRTKQDIYARSFKSSKHLDVSRMSEEKQIVSVMSKREIALKFPMQF